MQWHSHSLRIGGCSYYVAPPTFARRRIVPGLQPYKVVSTILSPSPPLLVAAQEDHADILQLLGAVESSACVAPRDRLELGLLPLVGNDPSKGIDKLHAAAVRSLGPANSSSEAVGFGIRCLLALGELCRELECSERLGLIGGHQSIVRLMMREQATVDMRRCDEAKSNVNLPPVSGDSDRQQQQQEQQVANGKDVHPTDIDVVGNDTDTEAGGDEQDEEGDEDEVQSAAAFVASRVVSTGCAFPMRPSFPAGEGSTGLGRFPLRYDFVIADAARKMDVEASHDTPTANSTSAGAGAASDGADDAAVDEDTAVPVAPSSQDPEHTSPERRNPRLANARDAKPATVRTLASNGGGGGRPSRGSPCDGESISILVRPVKERQHSQFDVGFVMWPAAVILSRLLCRDPNLVRGRRVLEVGAGLGLAGLVAARIQRSRPLVPSLSREGGGGPVYDDGAVASVTLSDFNPVVLKALEANVALNADRSERTKAAAEGAGGGRATVHVRHLDWDKLVDVRHVNTGVCGLDSPGCGGEPTRNTNVGRKAACGGGGREAGEGDESQEVETSELSSCESDSALSSDDGADGQQREVVSGGIGGIQHGERFDAIIASDHICQVR